VDNVVKHEIPESWYIRDLLKRQSTTEEDIHDIKEEQQKQHDNDIEQRHQIDDLHSILYRNGFRDDIKKLKRQQMIILLLLAGMFGDTVMRLITRLL